MTATPGAPGPGAASRDEPLLRAVEELACVMGAVAMRHYGTAIAVEEKGDGSPVTVADREAERMARDWLAEHFPDDAILGEEFGATPGAGDGMGAPGDGDGAPRRWLLDPIDGTKSFVRGVPLWGSLVALVQGERVLAGAACFPAVDELVAAAEGAGCWWNGRRARVSAVDALEQATALITDDRTFARADHAAAWRALSQRVRIARGWGDCFGHLLVATGRAEIMVDPVMNPWDAACFMPIIEEAGGVFTDLTGRRTAFGGHVLATNRALAPATRAAFGTVADPA